MGRIRFGGFDMGELRLSNKSNRFASKGLLMVSMKPSNIASVWVKVSFIISRKAAEEERKP